MTLSVTPHAPSVMQRTFPGKSSWKESAQISSEFFGESVVAAATCLLETAAVEDGNSPMSVADEPCVLKNSSRQGHSCPSRTKHLGEDLVGQVQRWRESTVLAHKQPTGEPLFERVEPVTQRCLRGLGEQEIRVPEQLHLEFRAADKLPSYDVGLDFESVSRNLGDGLMGAESVPQYRRDANYSFTSGNTSFYNDPLIIRDHQ